jgi:hypothetical protein
LVGEKPRVVAGRKHTLMDQGSEVRRERVVALVGGRLIDGTGKDSLDNSVVVVVSEVGVLASGSSGASGPFLQMGCRAGAASSRSVLASSNSTLQPAPERGIARWQSGPKGTPTAYPCTPWWVVGPGTVPRPTDWAYPELVVCLKYRGTRLTTRRSPTRSGVGDSPLHQYPVSSRVSRPLA